MDADATGALLDRIRRALLLPRRLMQDALERDRCPHSGYFQKGAQDCVYCEVGPECEWLLGYDEHAALESKRFAEVVEALEVSYSYIHARTLSQGHRERTCDCDACLWLRETQRLLSEVQALL
jgi:hypothetical protein